MKKSGSVKLRRSNVHKLQGVRPKSPEPERSRRVRELFTNSRSAKSKRRDDANSRNAKGTPKIHTTIATSAYSLIFAKPLNCFMPWANTNWAAPFSAA